MNLIETNKLLAILREMWPNHPWAENADKVWHLALANVPYEAVTAILPRLLQTQRYAPVPADLIALLPEVPGDDYALPNGEQAWEEIRAEIKRAGWNNKPRFSHPLIERTMRAFGWQEICGCQLDQLNTLRAQVERFHNQFRADAIAALKRGTPMHVAISSWADQKRIAGLVPVALPVGDDVEEVA